jgi:hypothetical protein
VIGDHIKHVADLRNEHEMLVGGIEDCVGGRIMKGKGVRSRLK